MNDIRIGIIGSGGMASHHAHVADCQQPEP